MKDNIFLQIFSREANMQSPYVFRSTILSSSFMIECYSKLHSLRGHNGCVNTILFSDDGTKAITGSDDTCIKLFDVSSGKLKSSISTMHTNNIFYAKDIPFSNCDKILSCAADGRVVHTAVSRGSSFEIHKHKGRAHRLATLPGCENEFISCGEDGKCNLFDLRLPSNTCNVLKFTFCDQDSEACPIYGVSINPIRPYEVIVGGANVTAQLFDTRNCDFPVGYYSPNKLMKPKDNPLQYHITGLSFNYSGEEILVTYNDDHIYTFHTREHMRTTFESPEHSPTSHTNTSIDDDDYSIDSENREENLHSGLMVSNINNVITMNDTNNGNNHNNNSYEDNECDDEESRQTSSTARCIRPSFNTKNYLKEFAGHRNRQTVKQVSYHGPRSEFVVSGSDCGHVFIWGSQSGKLISVFQADPVGAVNCLASHPYLPVLATSGLSHHASIWAPLDDPRPLKEGSQEKVEADLICSRNESRRLAAKRRGTRIRSVMSPQFLMQMIASGHFDAILPDNGEQGGNGDGSGNEAGAESGTSDGSDEPHRRIPRWQRQMLALLSFLNWRHERQADEDGDNDEDDDDDGDDESSNMGEGEEEGDVSSGSDRGDYGNILSSDSSHSLATPEAVDDDGDSDDSMGGMDWEEEGSDNGSLTIAQSRQGTAECVDGLTEAEESAGVGRIDEVNNEKRL